MPEELVASPEKRQRKPTEALSDDGRSAWRTAAIILVVNVILGAAFVFVSRRGASGFAWIIALVLAYRLYHLRAGADKEVMVLAGLAGVIVSAYYLRKGLTLAPLATLGLVASLFLLLFREARRPRRIAAVVVFCLLTVSRHILSIIGSLVGE